MVDKSKNSSLQRKKKEKQKEIIDDNAMIVATSYDGCSFFYGCCSKEIWPPRFEHGVDGNARFFGGRIVLNGVHLFIMGQTSFQII